MTFPEQVGNAIYETSEAISPASITRGLREMGVGFPLWIMAAKPQGRSKIPQGWHLQKHFWHLHGGLAYILWNETGKRNGGASLRGWLCGQPQFCPCPEEFIHWLQNAILAFRRVELQSSIRNTSLPLTFVAEMDMRRLALGRIREVLVAKSAFDDSLWQNALEIWLEIILLRHQQHLNTVHRKLSEFLCLITGDLDDHFSVSNTHSRIERVVYRTYSLGEIRKTFPQFVAELLHDFPLSSALSADALSPITKQALRWIEDHFKEGVSVADCAASIPVSSSYLSRLMTRETGLSPVQHLQQRRIDHARVLLQESHLAISAIAEKSGFGATEHFYRAFRKHTQLSPAAYRRSRMSPKVGEG